MYDMNEQAFRGKAKSFEIYPALVFVSVRYLTHFYLLPTSAKDMVIDFLYMYLLH